jgi:peptidyl-prolyl cis-trans isomerase A (cyclophilin A)
MTQCFPLAAHRTILPAITMMIAALLSGCSSDRKSGPPSIVDRLADAEKMRAAIRQPPAEESSSADTEEDSNAPTSGTFKVKFESSSGDFVVLVHREWAPIGAQRFYELVQSGYYNECRFFRVISGFMVQFGISGDPEISRRWDRNIRDDQPVQSNTRGRVTFATAGPNTRTTQIFINYGDNSRLDSDGFAPFGEVIEGMQNVDSIYSGYGERPNQGAIESRGNEYLNSSFPELDYVTKATVIEESKE